LRLCIDGHIKNRLTADARLKRGGGARNFEQMDFLAAERELSLADPGANPEEIFHREWQRQVFASAIADLRREHAASVRFQVFEQYDLASDPDQRPSYDEIARQHGIPVTSVTNHLAWARRELRKLVFDILSRTTGGDSEMRREARALFEPPPGEPG
jgi:DNA-directed RNA polymerase specialized sigma24 family protein